MKIIISLLMCAAMLLSTAVLPSSALEYPSGNTSEELFITNEGESSNMPEDYSCTNYDWEKYTSPFWKGEIVYNEAVYPIKAKDGSASYKLMYTPDRIIEVYDAQFKTKFREGTDYKVSGNTITFITTGSIPLKSYTYLHPENSSLPAGYSGWSPYYKRHAAGDGKYDYHTADVAKQYINVTYTHSDSWKGPVPAQHSDSLPKTSAKISSKGNLNIVYYGDSLCGGARASSYEHLYPYAEWWNQQITTRLGEGYGVNVNAQYSSVGGSTASSMSDSSTIAQYVTPYSPDLVVIEFGVNDAQNESVGGGSLSSHKSTYKNAVTRIINTIRQSYPNCEFLLVAPFYSNIALFKAEYFEACRDALNEIASSTTGTAVADVTTFHDYLLGFKNYADFSGDNLCHPNDYMSRIFSQICLETIVPGGVAAYVPSGEIYNPDEPDEPDKPDDAVLSYAAPDGHGWYWSEEEAYCLINGYGGNGQDIIITEDICLLPASDPSCAHLFTNDDTGGIFVYPDHVQIGSVSVAYDWGDVSWSNWHTVTFSIKNGTGKVFIDGKQIASASGFTAHTEHQMVFSHYGSMAVDNLSLKNSSGKVYWSTDFENRTDAENHMGEGLGEYFSLPVCNIKYDANGGKGSIGNQIKIKDISAAITTIKPEKDGFTFMGWAKTADAATAEYKAGDTYSANSSATLYAVWKEGEIHEHSFGGWTETKAPNCTETGIETRTCSCGVTEERTVPAKGHTEGETEVTPPTCTENGRSLVCCKVCGYHISDVPIIAEGHKFVDGICTICGTPDHDIPLGDVNDDGKINAADAVVLKKIIVGKSDCSKAIHTVADLNGDGKINAADVVQLKKKIVGKI